MPQTQINCPNCRQPVSVVVTQLFDVGANPAAKQLLLSGMANFMKCPHCGFQGSLAMPIVYHDPDKELLLTFIPAELGLPRNEQERVLGAQINQLINRLPAEKRKGYLLSPKSFLTLQSLVEHVLAADGITKEMIQAQEKRMELLQRMLSVKEAELEEIIKQSEEVIDAEFFSLLGRLGEAALLGNDQEGAQKVAALQNKLLATTPVGRELKGHADEIEAARRALVEAGPELTREKLLELVIQAPTETRLRAFVSFARPGMDYTFFQMLTDRIASASGEEESRLKKLRNTLLELTRQFDQRMETRMKQARENLEALMKADKLEDTIMQNLPIIDEFFIDVLNSELEATRKRGDLERSVKLNKIAEIIQQLSAPPELMLIEALMDAPDDETVRQIIQENKVEVNQEFLATIEKVLKEVQSRGDADLITRLERIQRVASSMFVS